MLDPIAARPPAAPASAPAPSEAAELELGALEATLPPPAHVHPHLPGATNRASTDQQGEPS